MIVTVSLVLKYRNLQGILYRVSLSSKLALAAVEVIQQKHQKYASYYNF